jgi:hypothetical protein
MVMKRTRAPGAGRRPMGNIKGKTKTFATRITAETRRALEVAAKRNGRSLSQEAEIILRVGLRDEKPSGKLRNHAVAEAVLYLAEGIELATGESWRKDVFTSMALRAAVEAVLFYFGPGTEEHPTVPPELEKYAAKMPPAFAEQYRDPVGFGHLRASGLVNEIEQSRPRPGKMVDEWDQPIAFNASFRRLGFLATDLETE